MRDRRRKYLPSPMPDPSRLVRAGDLRSIGDIQNMAGVRRDTMKEWFVADWWTIEPVAFTRAGALYLLPDILDCLEGAGKLKIGADE